jgi:hypothetical protein
MRVPADVYRTVTSLASMHSITTSEALLRYLGAGRSPRVSHRDGTAAAGSRNDLRDALPAVDGAIRPRAGEGGLHEYLTPTSGGQSMASPSPGALNGKSCPSAANPLDVAYQRALEDLARRGAVGARLARLAMTLSTSVRDSAT